MYTGHLSLGGPFDAGDPRLKPASTAQDAASETTFALLYETALALSETDCSAAEPSSNPFDTDQDPAGLLGNFDSTGLGTTNSSAAFSQLISQAGRSQVQPANLYEPHAAQPIDCISQSVNPAGSLASQPGVAGAIDKNELSNWMDAHALTRSSHRCAMYCRMGMEAAGLSTADRPLSGDAGDYGPFLLRHGAQTIPQDSYTPQVGDVVVFDKTSDHPFGHIQTYDGHRWVSDFVQHGLSPYSDARTAPPYTIYRFG